MVKVISAIKRKPGMSLELFTAHWRTTHAQLVMKVPAIARYVQSQTIESGYRNGEPVYDGVAELWYEDTAALHRAVSSPEARVTMTDNENFLDLNRFASLLTDEIVQKDGPADSSMVKLVEFVWRKPGMDVAAFQKHWREIHGPLAAKIPQISRYVQSHARSSSYRDGRVPPFDGTTQVWFASTDAMRQAATTAEYRAVRADEPNFVASGHQFIITRERVIA
jgi:uncharacterized protein (TIGR02118 family)